MMRSVTGTRRDEPRPWPLGPVLEEHRRNKKLSIRDASDRAGFSAATWSALEKGYKTPTSGVRVPYSASADSVRAAADAVGMDPAEALELAGVDAEPVGVRGGRYSLGQREILDLFAQLDPESRGALVTLLRRLVGVGDGDGGPVPELPAVGEVTVFEVKTSTNDR